MEAILANPILIIAVLVMAVIVGKVLKVTTKVIGAVICIGIAYFIVTRFLPF